MMSDFWVLKYIMFYKQEMGLVSYFTNFDSFAYYCCLISHKFLTSVAYIFQKQCFENLVMNLESHALQND